MPTSAKTIGTNELRELFELLRQSITKDSQLFPGGVTKLHLQVSLPGSTSLTIDIEGPDKHQSKPGSESGAISVANFHETTTAIQTTSGIPLESLGLAPHAKAGASSLVSQFGSDIVFTSGRRSVATQASAMAQNIVSTGDRKWIEKTYINGKELQNWVDANPQAITVAQLSAGLKSILDTWDNKKLAKLSFHLSGAAFDISPVQGDTGEKIKTAIQALENLNKFIENENGISVWHVQFDE